MTIIACAAITAIDRGITPTVGADNPGAIGTAVTPIAVVTVDGGDRIPNMTTDTEGAVCY